MKRILLLVVLLVFLGGKYGDAARRHVNGEVTVSGDGSSWANAYKTLQEALTVAVSGDEIWVAKGTYYPSSDHGLGGVRYKHFRMIDGVAIYGGFAGTENGVSERTNFGVGQTNETILSGNTDACYHVFYHPTAPTVYTLSKDAILDGFTVKGGNASGDSPHDKGGGFFNGTGSAPTIRNVTICNNFANDAGGGVYTEATSASFKIENATIRNNTSYGNGGGGGILINGSVTGTIANSLIFGNIGVYGGGIECGGTVELNNVTIVNNTASSGGGGVDNYNCDITLNNCIVWGNTTSGTGAQFGYLSSGTTTLNNTCYSNGTNDVVGVNPSDIHNSITTDPKFVNAAGSDFRLYGNSPCVNTGNNSYNAESYDVRGQTRIQYPLIDMGAYEFTSGIDPGGINLTWAQTSSTDWGVAANWNMGVLPTSTNDVTIPSGKEAVIGPTTTANCKNLTVEGTGSLTIQSDATGTGSLIISGTPSGNATVQRYVTSGGWRLIASPVTGQTVGSFLTSTGSILSANPGNGDNKAMKDYNEGSNEWNGLSYYTTSPEAMGANKGYAVWPASNGAVSFTGALQSGSVDVSVVRATTNGWNCIGNPYTSAIAINRATGGTNFIDVNQSGTSKFVSSYEAIYVWNQTAGSYDIVNHTYTGGAYYIPVGQAFFVRSAGTGPFSFTPEMQSHQNSAPFKSALVEWPEISINATANAKSSKAVVKFNQDMSNGLDAGYDAGIMEAGFDVYTRLVEDNGIDFGIQCLSLGDNYIIPVGIKSTEAGTVQLQLTSDLPGNYNVTFEDRERGITLPISESNQNIVVDVPANTTLANRFYLHVGSAGSAAGIDNWGNKLVVTQGKGQITISGVEPINGTATLYDVQGRKMSSVKLTNKQTNTMTTSGIRDGIYLLKVNQEGGSITRKVAVKN